MQRIGYGKNLGGPQYTYDADISLCEEVVKCLKGMKAVTSMLCAESTPTVSLILLILTGIIKNKLKDPTGNLNDAQKTVQEMKTIMKRDLENRYLDKKGLLSLVSALDPRFKTLPFLTKMRRMMFYQT